MKKYFIVYHLVVSLMIMEDSTVRGEIKKLKKKERKDR